MTVVPRLPYGLVGPRRFPVGSAWTGTRVVLPDGFPRWWSSVLDDRSALTGDGRLEVEELLDAVPVATLLGRP